MFSHENVQTLDKSWVILCKDGTFVVFQFIPYAALNKCKTPPKYVTDELNLSGIVSWLLFLVGAFSLKENARLLQ